MPPRIRHAVLTALALAVLAPASAFAADATVNIPSRAVSFTPATVTVGPNDTVTWVWTGPANERNHSPASDLRGAPESWDADPAVVPFSAKPDFDHGAGHTFAKTFVGAKAASYVYHCRVHSDMVGTVIVSGAPTPAFTATPGAPFAGDEVAFDASGSVDPDGSIARYEWDLDGNGTFETDTATTAAAAHTYAGPGPVTVALRVTDDIGNVRTVSHPLTVATRAPSASFTVAPGTAAKGANVTFDASASAATEGRTIAGYAWDLDGDGTFETDTGTTPSAARSYAAAGALTIGLRVTDSAGDSTTASRPLTIANTPPVAALTSTTTGATTSFDAGGSSDPDGTIAKFLWDLDGNGTFETDTGTTPTTSRAYTSTTTVKLRVVDDENATADATRTITVTPPPPPPPPPPSSTPKPPAPAPAAVTPAPVPPPLAAAATTAPAAPVARPAAPVSKPVATKKKAKAKKKAHHKKKKAKKKKRKKARRH
jgi:YD repeat-containing protein